jgi:uncharacterized protein (TIGR00369 family)
VKEIVRERTFTWTDPTALAQRLFDVPPIDWLKAAQAGEIPPAAVMSAIGMEIEDVREGSISFSFTAQEWMCNPAGVVHGGMTATLLDTVLTLAVMTNTPHGKTAQTIEMNVHYVRPVFATGEKIVAEGKTVHLGSTIATSEGRVHNAAGKLIAHGTATLAILDNSVIAARAKGR